MRRRQVIPLAILFASSLSMGACDDFAPSSNHAATAHAGTAPTPSPAAAPTGQAMADSVPPAVSAPPLDPPTVAASTNSRAQSIEAASFSQGPVGKGPSDLMIKVEVLLDRARFSPGVIDGRPGGNVTHALAAFEAARGLAGHGALDGEVIDALTKADGGPVTQDYVITADDEKGPFLGVIPKDMVALSKLKAVSYADSVQELAEKFHMSQGLLRALNPNADFTVAGTSILVVRPASPTLPTAVARLEVDKAANQVRAFDAGGKIVAVYPATVGSTERPAPTGAWAVKAVAPNPDYTYDPKRLTFGDTSKGVLTIPPGPNNPVGSTWIALTKETYGIHGSPDPNLIGKTASHGCVRLTNWDAATLGRAVKKGTPVVFVGETTKT
jgi:lipoprotein-anchoring transpeptidase ErfK/SrfK